MTSLQFLEEGGKREQVDEAACYIFFGAKNPVFVWPTIFFFA